MSFRRVYERVCWVPSCIEREKIRTTYKLCLVCYLKSSKTKKKPFLLLFVPACTPTPFHAFVMMQISIRAQFVLQLNCRDSDILSTYKVKICYLLVQLICWLKICWMRQHNHWNSSWHRTGNIRQRKRKKKKFAKEFWHRAVFDTKFLVILIVWWIDKNE